MSASRSEKYALKHASPSRVESVRRAIDEAEDEAGAAPCGMTGERRRRAAVRGERRRAAASVRDRPGPRRREAAAGHGDADDRGLGAPGPRVGLHRGALWAQAQDRLRHRNVLGRGAARLRRRRGLVCPRLRRRLRPRLAGRERGARRGARRRLRRAARVARGGADARAPRGGHRVRGAALLGALVRRPY